VRPDMIRPGVLAVLFQGCVLAIGAQAAALADAQGWSGPGWYITSTETATHAYILFEGPHISQSQCSEAYDRLYSPIGMCRFLDVKPLESAR